MQGKGGQAPSPKNPDAKKKRKNVVFDRTCAKQWLSDREGGGGKGGGRGAALTRPGRAKNLSGGDGAKGERTQSKLNFAARLCHEKNFPTLQVEITKNVPQKCIF